MHYLLIGYAIALFLFIGTVVRVLRLAKSQRREEQRSNDDINEDQIANTDIWKLLKNGISSWK